MPFPIFLFIAFFILVLLFLPSLLFQFLKFPATIQLNKKVRTKSFLQNGCSNYLNNFSFSLVERFFIKDRSASDSSGFSLAKGTSICSRLLIPLLVITSPDSLISLTSFWEGPAWVSGSSASSRNLLKSGHSLSMQQMKG